MNSSKFVYPSIGRMMPNSMDGSKEYQEMVAEMQFLEMVLETQNFNSQKADLSRCPPVRTKSEPFLDDPEDEIPSAVLNSLPVCNSEKEVVLGNLISRQENDGISGRNSLAADKIDGDCGLVMNTPRQKVANEAVKDAPATHQNGQNALVLGKESSKPYEKGDSGNRLMKQEIEKNEVKITRKSDMNEVKELVKNNSSSNNQAFSFVNDMIRDFKEPAVLKAERMPPQFPMTGNQASGGIKCRSPPDIVCQKLENQTLVMARDTTKDIKVSQDKIEEKPPITPRRKTVDTTLKVNTPVPAPRKRKPQGSVREQKAPSSKSVDIASEPTPTVSTTGVFLVEEAVDLSKVILKTASKLSSQTNTQNYDNTIFKTPFVHGPSSEDILYSNLPQASKIIAVTRNQNRSPVPLTSTMAIPNQNDISPSFKSGPSSTESLYENMYLSSVTSPAVPGASQFNRPPKQAWEPTNTYSATSYFNSADTESIRKINDSRFGTYANIGLTYENFRPNENFRSNDNFRLSDNFQADDNLNSKDLVRSPPSLPERTMRNAAYNNVPPYIAGGSTSNRNENDLKNSNQAWSPPDLPARTMRNLAYENIGTYLAERNAGSRNEIDLRNKSEVARPLSLSEANAVNKDENLDEGKLLVIRTLRNKLKALCFSSVQGKEEEMNRIVEEMFKVTVDLNTKYSALNLAQLLKNNEENSVLIASALAVLHKYAVNLLKPVTERPSSWKSIKFYSKVVQDRVGFLKESKPILIQLGYTEDLVNSENKIVGLKFPDNVNDPDRVKVAEMAVDLWIAHCEVLAILNEVHPHLKLLFDSGQIPRSLKIEELSDDDDDFFDAEENFVASPAVAQNASSDNALQFENANSQFNAEDVYMSMRNDAQVEPNRREFHNLAQPNQSQMHTEAPSLRPAESPPHRQMKMSNLPQDTTWSCSSPITTSFENQFCVQSSKRDDVENFHRSTVLSGSSNRLPSIYSAFPPSPPAIDSRNNEPPWQPYQPLNGAQPQSGSKPQFDVVPQIGTQSQSGTQLLSNLQLQHDAKPQSGSTNHQDSDDVWKKTSGEEPRYQDPSREGDHKPFHIDGGSDTFSNNGFENAICWNCDAEIPDPNYKKCFKCGTPRDDLNESQDEYVMPNLESISSITESIKSAPTSDKPESFYSAPIAESIYSAPTTHSPEMIHRCYGAHGDDLMHSVPTKQKADTIYFPPTSHGPEAIYSAPTSQTPESVYLAVMGNRPNSVYRPNTNFKPDSTYSVPKSNTQGEMFSVLTSHEAELIYSAPNSYKPEPEGRMETPPPDEELKDYWSCKHCTFHNPMDTKICRMCLKTSFVSGKKEDPEFEIIHATYSTPQSPIDAASFPPQYHVFGKETFASRMEDPPVLPIHRNRHEMQNQLPSVYETSTRPPDSYMPYSYSETSGFINGSPSSYNANKSAPEIYQANQFPRRPSLKQKSKFGNPEMYLSMSDHELRKQKELAEQVRREKKLQEDMRKDAVDLINVIKEAEELGYSIGEVQIASNFDQMLTCNILDWLQKTLPEMKNIVIKCFSEKDLGNLSAEEAGEALIACDGDIQKTVNLCAQERQTKVDILAENENKFEKADIIDAVSNCKGDLQKALMELENKSLKNLYNRLWEDNPEGLEILHQKLQNKEINKDERTRLVFGYYGMRSWGRASNAIRLMELEENKDLVEDCIEAANCNEAFQRAQRFMNHECNVCYSRYAMFKLFTHMYCQCEICHDCMAENIAVIVKEQNIRNLVCPACQEPKFNDEEVEPMQHFQHIGHEIVELIRKGLLDPNIHQMFEEKLRDFSLKSDPNFRWCAHCPEYGFLWEEPLVNKMLCAKCKKHTCFTCKEKWEIQHEGITCEEFKTWKMANDPENQMRGLDAHLAKHGITCPKCNTRFDLAQGGCLHFSCSNCKYQFCGECFQEFLAAETCKEHPKSGLHAHHPRNCLFYQRDQSVAELKQLLTSHQIEFDIEKPADQAENKCHFMEQKHEGDRKYDEACGKEVSEGNAGLCEKHYKEYLIKIINQNRIDPLDNMEQKNIEILIKRHFLDVPQKEASESDEVYIQRLRQFAKEKIPLPFLGQNGNKIPPPPPPRQPMRLPEDFNDNSDEDENDFEYIH